MSKLSQRELLEEGFLDTVRKAAIAAGGATLGAVKNVAKDIITANPNADLFSSIKAGAASGAKTGWNVGTRLTSPTTILKDTLKKEYYNSFDFKTIEYGKEEKNQVNKNVTNIPFTAIKQGSNNKENFSGEVIRDKDKFTVSIKDKDGNAILNAKRNGRTTGVQPGTRGQPNRPTNQGQQQTTATKPKFVDALRTWKVNNIGPNAATVGINYQQAKTFLQSLNVQDPDRVLYSAGVRSSGSQILSNRQLSDIEYTLKSRNLIECTQIDTLNQFKLLF